MTLDSLPYFIFLFFAVIFTHVAPKKYRIGILILFSLGFMASWGWLALLTFLICIVCNYFLAIQYIKNNTLYGFILLFNVCIIISFKLIANQKVHSTTGMDILQQNILPLGVSYYIFQMLAYLVDLKRGIIFKPLSLKEYIFFNGFFAQISIGPIERYKNMYSQIHNPVSANYSYIIQGLILILVGLIKKNVIADRLVEFIELGGPEEKKLVGLSLVTYIISSFFQIYCDFSGYTNIARGSGKLLGFNLSKNFNKPYLATKVSDAWSRWHMTLVSWVRDYIYFPLLLKTRKIHIAILLSFFVVGMWHSVSWTYFIWAIYWSSLTLLQYSWRKAVKSKVTFPRFLNWLYVFLCLILGTILFMCHNVSDFISIIGSLFFEEAVAFNSLIALKGFDLNNYLISIVALAIIIFYEVIESHIFRIQWVNYLLFFFLSVVFITFFRPKSYNFIYLGF